jgi:hypothetical protein
LAAPGSHKQPSRQLIKETGFDFPGLIPVPAKAGDVLIHNTRVVHGSHKSKSPSLRRTIYYEFCSMEFATSDVWKKEILGLPECDNLSWASDRAKLIKHAIEYRKTCSYAKDETPFDLKTAASMNIELKQGEEVDLAPGFGGSYR